MRHTGTVRWFDRSFGFITENGVVDYFIHQRDILVDGFRSLKAGQVVSFDAVETDKGLKATNVTLAED